MEDLIGGGQGREADEIIGDALAMACALGAIVASVVALAVAVVTL